MIDKQLLLQGCKQFEIELSTQAAEQLDTYAQLLVEWNGKMNLTAITDPQGIVFKHFVDSLLLLKAVELPQGSSLIDVGAGAGFPSMPVKIVRPDLAVTMLDSLQKRLTFLEEVSRQLELDCTFIHARAEDGGREKKLRERFDFATARAVAHLGRAASIVCRMSRWEDILLHSRVPAHRRRLRKAKMPLRRWAERWRR